MLLQPIFSSKWWGDKVMKNKIKKIKIVKGSYQARGKRFGLVVAQFNEYLTRQLEEGAIDTLLRHGANEKNIHIIHVPGAFEIPLTVKKMLKKIKLDAVLALAVVIRGETKHFDQVVQESAKGVREVGLSTEVPIILGIVTAENAEQAISRVGVKHMNKGREWALSAIEMANLMKLSWNGNKKNRA